MSFSSTDEYQKFETLFKQYYSGLVVYASRFTGNTENAKKSKKFIVYMNGQVTKVKGSGKKQIRAGM